MYVCVDMGEGLELGRVYQSVCTGSEIDALKLAQIFPFAAVISDL